LSGVQVPGFGFRLTPIPSKRPRIRLTWWLRDRNFAISLAFSSQASWSLFSTATVSTLTVRVLVTVVHLAGLHLRGPKKPNPKNKPVTANKLTISNPF
jgi:hypothetical protein